MSNPGQGSECPGKAIPFIALEGGEFRVTEEAKDFLSTVEAPISVISVAGMYRTGKSFLLNHILLERNDGFEVGPTVEACTKGLWIWNQVIERPVQGGGVSRSIVIDTEGIGSTQAAEKHDATIFSLSLLMSSYFIYNSVGCIDERAINSLSLVANLTEHINVKGKNRNETGAEFSMHFPSFLWLVRDFALQLINPEGKPISAKDYLELALKETPGFNEQIESKNRIRRMLCSFFPTRDCCTLVRPVTDEDGLQRLSSTPPEMLRPEFREQVQGLQARVFANAPSKRVGRVEVDGKGLLDLGQAYVSAINGGAVPAIQDAYSQVCDSRLLRAVAQALAMFESEVALAAQEEPVPDRDARKRLREMEARARRTFEAEAVDGDIERHRADLETRLADLGARMVSDNATRLEKRSLEFLEKAYSPVAVKVSSGAFESYDEYESERKRVKMTCREHDVSTEAMSIFMEERISDFASRMDTRRKADQQSERNKAEEAVRAAKAECEIAAQKHDMEVFALKQRLEQSSVYLEEVRERERKAREDEAKEVERLRGCVREEEARRRESEHERDKIRNDVAALQRERDREKDEKEREKESRSQREADLVRLLDEAKRDTDDMRAEREQERGEREGERLRAERQMSELRSRCEALENKVAALEQELRHSEVPAQYLRHMANEKLQEALEKAEESPGGGGGGEKYDVFGGGMDVLKIEVERLKNMEAVGLEEIRRLERQMEGTRREVKEESERYERVKGLLETAEMEKRSSDERVATLTKRLKESQKAAAKATKDKEAAEREMRGAAGEAQQRGDALLTEREAQLSNMEIAKVQMEGRITSLEREREELGEELKIAARELEQARAVQEQGMTVSEQQWSSKIRDLEVSHKKQLADIRAANAQLMDQASGFVEQEKKVLELRVQTLEAALRDLKEEKEERQAESAEAIKDLEAALDELERDGAVQVAKAVREGEQKLQAAETKFVRAESELLRKVEVAKSKSEALQQQLTELSEVYKEDRKEAATRHEAEVRALEREVKSVREQLESEKQQKKDLRSKDKDGLSGAASDVVAGLSSVLSQKTAELEAFKESSEQTVSTLNRLVEATDVENEQLRRCWKIFVLHCLRVQCRYCGRDVLTVQADEHVSRCMEQRGIMGWHDLSIPPPGLDVRVEVGGSMMQNVDGKSKRVYLLEVRQGLEQWEVARRYSDFVRLHKALKTKLLRLRLPDISQLQANTASVFQNEAQTIDQRRAQIADYFAQVLKISAVVESEEMVGFLELSD